MNANLRRQSAEDYLAERTGKLEYRFIRYAAVADESDIQVHSFFGMDRDSILAVSHGRGL